MVYPVTDNLPKATAINSRITSKARNKQKTNYASVHMMLPPKNSSQQNGTGLSKKEIEVVQHSELVGCYVVISVTNNISYLSKISRAKLQSGGLFSTSY